MNTIFRICIILSLIANICFADDKVGKIAIVVPIEHRAMNEIVKGVKDNLKGKINDDKVVVFNAMGDRNNMNTIINQVAQNNEYQAILPIGTNATYLALSATKDKSIVSLASTIDEKTRKELITDGHINITNVYDEVSSDNILEFISAIKKRNILLIFSNDERIINQVKELEEKQLKYDLQIHKFNVSNSTDIYTIDSAISNVDCILFLKDHLIVSMMNVITSHAHDKNIFVIASDEGSTISGADIGLGVDEYDIGAIGAEMLKEILDGKKPADIPVRTVKDIKIFYNANSNIDQLKVVSNKLGYELKEIIIKQDYDQD